MITKNEALHQLYDDLESAISLLIAAVHAEAFARGKAEGKAEEHGLIFGLLRASCCHPIDGDKLFSETLPASYGDALPIKETK